MLFSGMKKAGAAASLAALALVAGCGGGGSGDGAGDSSGVVTPVAGTPAPPANSDRLAAVRAAAKPITGSAQDYADIFAAAASARRITLGDSTHGTAEYYRERGRITDRLVREQGVNAITIESDWSPAWRVNLYVRGLGTDTSATQALQGFTGRFPAWMWRNAEFRDFVEGLRAVNLARPLHQRVGLYGMDVYDLYEAADAVIAYLQQRDPAMAQRVSALYACFEPFDRSTEAYGRSAARGIDTCRDEAESAQAELATLPRPADPEQAEYHFGALGGAASVAAAEEYFRVSYAGGNSWNVRDRRMVQTVDDAAAHAQALSGQPGKTVSWSHNTHAGDDRATSMGSQGELNLGQLLRERHGDAALLVGFFSHSGTVMAAPVWGQAGQVYQMLPALPGSYSALFHDAGIPTFSLMLRGNGQLASAFGSGLLERAIGVIYLPETERQSHYFDARLAQQFDAAVFIDRTSAVSPLP
jgi:erythromycin esterase-like protein